MDSGDGRHGRLERKAFDGRAETERKKRLCGATELTWPESDWAGLLAGFSQLFRRYTASASGPFREEIIDPPGTTVDLIHLMMLDNSTGILLRRKVLPVDLIHLMMLDNSTGMLLHR